MPDLYPGFSFHWVLVEGCGPAAKQCAAGKQECALACPELMPAPTTTNIVLLLNHLTRLFTCNLHACVGLSISARTPWAYLQPPNEAAGSAGDVCSPAIPIATFLALNYLKIRNWIWLAW